eukprot:jgi/Chlat1/4106/Chrsp26S04121
MESQGSQTEPPSAATPVLEAEENRSEAEQERVRLLYAAKRSMRTSTRMSRKKSFRQTTTAFHRFETGVALVVGLGILSYPYIFRVIGVGGAVAVTIAVALLTCLTTHVLVVDAQLYDAHSYEELVQAAVGHYAGLLVSFVVVVYLFGVCTSYLIILGDMLPPLLFEVFGPNPLFNRNFAVLAAAVPLLPLSLLRSLHLSALVASLLSPIVVAYVGVLVVYRGVQTLMMEGMPQLVWFNADLSAIRGLPIAIFVFNVHIQVLPAFSELARLVYSSNVLGCESYSTQRAALTTFESVVRMSTIGLAAFAMLFGWFAYVRYPNVSSNVLASYPYDRLPENIARVGLALMAILAYPVKLFPGRVALDDLLCHVTKCWPMMVDGFMPTHRHLMQSFVLYAGTIVFALTFHSLGQAICVMGAIVGVFLVFFVPGALLWRSIGETGDSDIPPAPAVDAVSLPLLAQEAHAKPAPALSSSPWLRKLLIAVFMAMAAVMAFAMGYSILVPPE